MESMFTTLRSQLRMSTLARVTRLLGSLREGCNSIEMHIVKGGGATTGTGAGARGGGWARVDLTRDETIAMMRLALGSRFLSSCKTRQCRLQSSHVRDLTLERFLNVSSTSKDRKNAQEHVESSKLLGVYDMRQSDTDTDDLSAATIPLVWMEWNKQRLPQAAFPCVMQRHDVRHCIRREIACSESVALFFETHMNESAKSVYRVWIQVNDLRDLKAVALGVTRALDGLGING